MSSRGEQCQRVYDMCQEQYDPIMGEDLCDIPEDQLIKPGELFAGNKCYRLGDMLTHIESQLGARSSYGFSQPKLPNDPYTRRPITFQQLHELRDRAARLQLEVPPILDEYVNAVLEYGLQPDDQEALTSWIEERESQGSGSQGSQSSEVTPQWRAIRDYTVPSAALQRLVLRAGIAETSAHVYPELRGALNEFLRKLLAAAIIQANYALRKTIKEADVSTALRHLNRASAFTDSVQIRRRVKDEPKLYRTVTELVSRTRRCVPYRASTMHLKGERASNLMRHLQEYSSHCFALSVNGFQQLVRYLAQEQEADVRFSPGALAMIQAASEEYLLTLVTKAAAQVRHARRKRIMPADLRIVKQLMEN